MANVKISDLPAASSAAGTDQLETNQSGTSRRLTVAQVATHVRSTATDTVVVAAGSASAPSISPTGDSNTGIFFPAADTIAFSEGGVEAMRIDSSANVGIGTSLPATRLDISGGTTTLRGPALFNTSSTSGTNSSAYIRAANSFSSSTTPDYAWWYDDQTGLFHPATATIGFTTGGVERMRIDGSGNVGIGTSSAGNRLTVAGSGQFTGTISQNSTGTHIWYQSDLSYLGAWGPNSSTNGTLVFYSARSDGSNGLERARITEFGDLLVGTASSDARITSRSSNPNIAALGTRGVSGDLGTPHLYITKFDNNSTTAQVFIRFVVNNGAVPSGQINANGANAAAFGTWSDARLKENIVDLPPQLENICALRPVEFDYKDGSGHQVGFIAQEMQAVYPDVVAASNDEMLQVTGWSKTEARIVKALQELKAENDALKARVAALEAK